MRIIDRHLLKEMVKFTLLALASVVIIYLLIDLFEELSYFTTRKVSFLVILKYYFYSLPSAATLLYPVSLILAVFVVYGQMTRYNEIAAFKSSGIIVYRLFAPAIVVGAITIIIYLLGNEFVTVPFNRRLSDLRRYVIEKRGSPENEKRQDVYRIDANIVLWARELEKPHYDFQGITLRNFLLIKLNKKRRVVERIDGEIAVYDDSGWVGMALKRREFDSTGKENYHYLEKGELDMLEKKAVEWGRPARPVEEIPTLLLSRYINQLKAIGENVVREEVEYHYRFSYALIGLIVVLLGLPLSVKLRRGGVMLGLGLGLLFSFLYWGVIQTCRALGGSHVVTPAVAAWLPNLIFAVVAAVLFFQVER
ncbi:MAG: LptF/LptG family permease [candidate division WOR-3 bacterium]